MKMFVRPKDWVGRPYCSIQDDAADFQKVAVVRMLSEDIARSIQGIRLSLSLARQFLDKATQSYQANCY